MSVILGLNSKKGVAAEVVRALTVKNKVWLMFVQGKRYQKSVSQTYTEVKNEKASYS